VAKGMKIDFNFVYSTGIAPMTNSIQAWKSDASRYAGITLNLKGTTFNSAISLSVPCKVSTSKCNWDIVQFGGWVYGPDYYPTGGELFKTGAGANYGNYSSKQMDNLIGATHLAGNPKATLDNYQHYVVDQVPVLWTPSTPYELTEVNCHLKGVTYNVYLGILPEQWYLTKGSCRGIQLSSPPRVGPGPARLPAP
jgi:peptide/nickel transport system substrate-binding protein